MGHHEREIKARSGRWRVQKRLKRDGFVFFDPTTSLRIDKYYMMAYAQPPMRLRVENSHPDGRSGMNDLEVRLECVESTLVLHAVGPVDSNTAGTDRVHW
jgi:hypothetical protein